MALFELEQHYENEQPEYHAPTFKECAAEDIDLIFFDASEHAETRNVDGNDVVVIFEDSDLRERSAHWEAGTKQNFDTGLYLAHCVLYIKVKDYGPKPKIGKMLVMDAGTDHKRTYTINKCEEEDGVYRMIMERVRQ